ncbi:hypothetical protein TREES_T100004016 [Tupaia chinensis]|uniref:Uncharacterized protein n=1 Tax=Tupaia chinensis TaxID=246437 RepID=L9KSE0_TUPCH|nr:hypothetical protein TREES_T100004016 [Tupaia chinensis]
MHSASQCGKELLLKRRSKVQNHGELPPSPDPDRTPQRRLLPPAASVSAPGTGADQSWDRAALSAGG